MSDSTQWQTIKHVLQKALERDAKEWPRLLDSMCEGDDELRAQIESLLCQRDDKFMATPVLAEVPGEAGLIGSTIGRYRVVRALGAGGMGEVFEAEQIEPFVRTVAIKLLRRGLYSRELTERFDSEHRALAMMNHPNIAQVFDADWTADERPYFVMEYVPGKSIADALDERDLALRERIDLFLQVCEGVAHAHRKGIIHRDLKPSNVLVTVKGGQLVAKIIDFGVAKGVRAIARSNALPNEQTAPDMTRAGSWIGTSGYASPEQVTGQTDVDTRTDVYSLGALLYEVVARAPAYSELALANASRKERLRIICEQQPEPPSQACASTQARQALVGDLDSIVRKAMAKQPAERYATVAQLSDDLRRHLRHEPVLAVAPSWHYRIRKLARRRALGVGIAATAIFLLLAGATAAGLGYFEAVKAQKMAAEAAMRASTEARKASQVAAFLASLFRVSDPTQGAGNEVSAREILEQGAERIDSELLKQPATRAMLLDTIGVVYTNLGLYEEADQHLTRAFELRRELYAQAHGDMHVDMAESLNHLGKLLYFRGQFDQAKAHYERALLVHQSLLGDTDVRTADSHNNLGEVLLAQADFAASIAEHERALAIRRQVLGPQHRDVGMSLNNLAGALRRSGDSAAAQTAYRSAIAVNRQALGDTSSEVATNLSNLGVFLMSTGKYEEAFDLHNDALRIRRQSLDAGHPHIANSLHNVGSLQVHLGNFSNAQPLVLESLAMHEALHGEQHPLVALTRNNLGVVLEHLGQHDDAASHYIDALEVFEATVGRGHPYVAITLTNHARLLVTRGEFASAEAMAATAATSLSSAIAPDHWRVAVANSVRGAALAGLGRVDEAKTLLTESLAVIVQAQGENTPYSMRARERLDKLARAPENAPSP